MTEFSIVLPSFNAEDIVIKTIRKITHVLEEDSSFTFEICVVLDGLSQSTMELLKGEQLINSHLRVLQLHRRHGLWKATVAGIKFAVGKYIITCDDDGEYPPEAIMKLINHHKAHPELKLLFGLPDDANQAYLNERRSVQNFIAGQEATSSLRLFSRELVSQRYPDWMYIDAYFSSKLPPCMAARVAVPYRLGPKRMSAWQKGKLVIHAACCYTRTLMIALVFMLMPVVVLAFFDSSPLRSGLFILCCSIAVAIFFQYIRIRKVLCL